MRRILIIISVIVTLCVCVACHSVKETTDNIYGSRVNVTYVKALLPDTLSINQIDSVVRTDKLPDYSYWKQSTFRDEETNESVTYKTLYDPTTNVIYTVKPYKRMFILFKKQVKSK